MNQLTKLITLATALLLAYLIITLSMSTKQTQSSSLKQTSQSYILMMKKNATNDQKESIINTINEAGGKVIKEIQLINAIHIRIIHIIVE